MIFTLVGSVAVHGLIICLLLFLLNSSNFGEMGEKDHRSYSILRNIFINLTAILFSEYCMVYLGVKPLLALEILAVCFVILFAIGLYRNLKKSSKLEEIYWNSDFLWVTFFALWVQTPALLLSIKAGGLFGMETTGNNDVASYAMVANEFLKSGFRDSLHLLNYDINFQAQTFSYQTPNLLISLLASLLRLHVWQVMTITMILALALVALSASALIQKISSKIERKWRLSVGFLILLLPIVIYLIGNYFLSQVISIALCFAITALFLNVYSNHLLSNKDFIFLISLTILSSLTYPHFLIPFLLFMTLFTLLYIKGVEKKDCGGICKRILLSLGLGFIASMPILLNLWKFIVSTFGMTSNGWPLPKLSPIALFGSRYLIGKNLGWASYIVSWALFVFISLLLAKYSQMERQIKRLTSIFLFLVIFGIVGLILIRKVPLENYTNWKLISYFAPLVALVLVAYLVLLGKRGKTILFIGLLFLSINPMLDWASTFQSHRGAITADMSNLSSNPKLKQFQKLNVDTNPWFETMALASIINSSKLGLVNSNYYVQFQDRGACSIVRRDNRNFGTFLNLNKTYGITASLDGHCGKFAEPEVMQVTAGEEISFKVGGNGSNAVVSGWSSAEDWGTWSTGANSLLRIRLKSSPRFDVKLRLKGHPFLTSQFSQKISIKVNGVNLYSQYASHLATSTGIGITIPKELILKKSNNIELEMHFDNPHSPLELKMSNDPRQLGFGLIAISIN